MQTSTHVRVRPSSWYRCVVVTSSQRSIARIHLQCIADSLLCKAFDSRKAELGCERVVLQPFLEAKILRSIVTLYIKELLTKHVVFSDQNVTRQLHFILLGRAYQLICMRRLSNHFQWDYRKILVLRPGPIPTS